MRRRTTADTIVVSVRMDVDLKQALDEVAFAEYRTRSSLVQMICRDWLEQRGRATAEIVNLRRKSA